MTRRGHWTGTSTWTWTRPQRQDKAPRTGLGLRGFCVPCPLDDVIVAILYMRMRKPDNCHAEILMHWNIIIGKCAIVVWFPFTCVHNTHTHIVTLFACVCVCVCLSLCVYASQWHGQSGSLYIDYVWYSVLSVDANSRPCPALPCPLCPYWHIRYLCHITS